MIRHDIKVHSICIVFALSHRLARSTNRFMKVVRSDPTRRITNDMTAIKGARDFVTAPPSQDALPLPLWKKEGFSAHNGPSAFESQDSSYEWRPPRQLLLPKSSQEYVSLAESEKRYQCFLTLSDPNDRCDALLQSVPFGQAKQPRPSR